MKGIGIFMGLLILLNSYCYSAEVPKQPFEADMYTMGLWHFDEGEGKTTKDEAGFGANGTLKTNAGKKGVLPEWVEGKFGQALKFHGNWDVVELNDTKSLKIEGPITIEAWVKLDNPEKTAGLIAVNKSSSSSGFRLEYTVWKQHQGFGFTISSEKKESTVYSLPMMEKLASDTWYYVAAIYDGKKLKIYLDGKDVTQEKVESKTFTESEYTNKIIWPVYIGGYQESYNVSFRGVIDEVRISNVARSF